jgi:tetratricopeptide (TPR) repeat protein
MIEARRHEDRDESTDTPRGDDLKRQANFESIRFSYLKRHYFEPEALRDRTLDEFHRAMRTGRMIAFTGSMTTEDRGYVTWNQFVNACFRKAQEHFQNHSDVAEAKVKQLSDLVEKFRSREIQQRLNLDHRVSFSIIGETVDLAAQYSGASHVNPNKTISEDYFLNRPKESRKDRDTVLEALLHDLNIDRVLTLNYDLEAELEYCHRPLPGQGPRNAIEALGEITEGAASGTLIKRLPGARSLVSDIFDRDRTDRLIEFAVGSADHEYHVLHLHGRADAFDSMVVSYRDYDRLYRRSGLSKAPFEHALKLVFAGNPILFVGLGLSESDVNRTLQDYVGNHPYRRIMPTFLIWNSLRDEEGRPDQSACDIFRIDKLHRLGVLTLFSHELQEKLPRRWQTEQPTRSGPLDELRDSLVTLGQVLKVTRKKRHAKIESWRSMAARAQTDDQLVGLWEVVPREPSKAAADPKAIPPETQMPIPEALDLNRLQARLAIAVGRSGIGKGQLARSTAHNWLQIQSGERRVLLLNADHCLDTDVMLNLVCHFLAKHSGYDCGGMERSRNSMLQDPQLYAVCHPVRIVIAGTERLFGANGEPLSAEFDEMLRGFLKAIAALPAAAADKIGFLIFATPRVLPYIKGVAGRNSVEGLWSRAAPERSQPRSDTGPLLIIELDRHSAHSGHSNYLDAIIRRGRPFKAVPGLIIAEKNNVAHELSAFRRSLYASVLDPRSLEAMGLGESSDQKLGRLAVDILTVMAHIGQPVEPDVLFLAPRVQNRLRRKMKVPTRRTRRVFHDVLAWLAEHDLVVALKPFEGTIMRRYGLHQTLLAEIRERSGVPLSEAVLSTAFNMSLYTAQPTGGPLPEPFLHDELGQLIDWMIGAHKDKPYSKSAGQVGDRTRPDAIAALRAALAVVRGFYSTTTLLTLNGKDRVISLERDGSLTEHAERLERLLAGFRACVDELDLRKRRSRIARPEEPDDLPSGPFYPDEIVWLYNEIGVVKLAQGDLYEARFALDEADWYNRQYVEFGDRTHNWRRIVLNQIVLDLERGKLETAESRIRQIQSEIGDYKMARAKHLVKADLPIPLPTDAEVSHEEILAIGLVTGYRGICSHLIGEAIDALEHYDFALNVLRRLDERRAYATFLRHKAALLRDFFSVGDADLAMDLAISAAESVRQMDLVHHSRIQRARRDLKTRDIDRWREASRILHEALVFAEATDMHRVRIEARANLALANMASGDFEVALEHASDALTVATRFGLSLRKISLRVLIGRILMRRGDPQSGKALIESGRAAASRVGYQQVVSNAQKALMEVDWR